MSSIQQFNFNDKELRTHIKNGEIWYVAKDVYACLWIKWWWNRSLSAIKPEWRGVGQITTTWWIKDTAIINEKAVYKIAFRSKKETANKFTDFMAEVAEELRKTWSYTMVKPRSNAHALLEQMKVLVKHEEEIQELQDADSKLNQRQDELEAKIKTIDESHYTMAWWCSLKKSQKVLQNYSLCEEELQRYQEICDLRLRKLIAQFIDRLIPTMKTYYNLYQ